MSVAVDWGTITNRRTSGTGYDYTSKTGAEVLKLKIEAYWRERGHEVQVDLQEKLFHPVVRCARWDVRSTLVDGLPKGAK